MKTALMQQRLAGRVRPAASSVALTTTCVRERGTDAASTAVYTTGLGFGLWTTGAMGHNHGSVNPMGIPATKRPAQRLRVRST